MLLLPFLAATLSSGGSVADSISEPRGNVHVIARSIVVNSSSASASDANPGTTALPLLTISAGAALAQPGDTVLVAGGTVYRERVAPPRGGTEHFPITYAAASGPQPTIRGSEPLPSSRWRPAAPSRRTGAGDGERSGAPDGAPEPDESPERGTAGVVWIGDVSQLPFEEIAGAV